MNPIAIAAQLEQRIETTDPDEVDEYALLLVAAHRAVSALRTIAVLGYTPNN